MTTKLDEAALDEDVGRRLEALLAAEPWASHFSACATDPKSLAGEAGRFRDALAALEDRPQLDVVERTLLSLAGHENPQGAAAGAPAEVDTVPDERWSTEWASEYMGHALQRLVQELPAGSDVPALDAETDEIYAASEAEDRERYRRAVDAWIESALRGGCEAQPPWNDDWACNEIARALLYIRSRVQSGDDPEAKEEWQGVIAAQTACDAPRFSSALRAAVRASLKELAREGRLRTPEPAAAPAKHEFAPGSPAPETASQQAPAGSAWGARPAYREGA